MAEFEPAWIPKVTIPDDPDIPTSFDDMWSRGGEWKAVFEAWAGDQPGWTGPLTEAVMAMAEWGGSMEPAADVGRWILGRLTLASPPVDAPALGRADLALQGIEGGAPGDLFDELYPSAYEILSQDRITYGAFYNDVATYKNRTVSQIKLVGPLPDGQWHRPAVGTDTEYHQMRNVWIQTPDGPQILKATEGEEDVWFEAPDDWLARIAETNGENVKDLDDGDTAPVVQLGELVLIGIGHNIEEQTIAGDYGVSGQVIVKKGSGLDPGALTFTGMYDQDAVRRQVTRFSRKKCRFA